MGESLAIQHIGMVRTQEEPVQQPIIGSSSVTVSSVAEVLWYGLALLWVMWWWYLVGIFVFSQIIYLFSAKLLFWKGSLVLPENLVETRTEIMTI
jgi:hypothetical protein